MIFKRVLFNYFDMLNWLSKRLFGSYKNLRVVELQVNLFYQQIPTVVMAASIAATALSLIFYDTAGINAAIWWLSSVYLLTLARLFSRHQYKKNTKSLKYQHWAAIGITFSMLSGIQWGIAALVYFNPQSAVDIAILTLVVLAMTAAAVPSLSVIPLAYVMYVVTSSSMMAYALFVSGFNDFYVLGILVLVYLFTMLFFCLNIYKATMRAINLSVENADLVENLQIEKNKSENANQAKSRFLAAASHDLRQPIQALTLFTEALKENIKGEENTTLVGRISKSLDALKGLLNSLLDISKLDAGGVKVHKDGFDVSGVLEEIRAEFQQTADNKQQHLVISKSSGYVFTDPILVKRIIQNLVANAINHSPEEVMITIDVIKRNQACTISIKDNGPGIPEQEISKVFNEFHQLNNPERDRNKGLGLGLAIVKRLADLLDIPIELKSKAGEGCEFSLVLPEATADQIVKNTAKINTLSVSNFNGLNVLVVEDEIDVRESMAALLESWGCEVQQTDNISRSIEFAKQLPLDLVITDYRLRQNETGLDLLKQLKTLSIDIPGLVITGDTAVEQLKEFMDEDYWVLHKPIKPAQLRIAIQRLTSEKA